MRRVPALLLALPAALVAQDKAPETLTQRLRAESATIDRLMKEHNPKEALAKCQALLPATKPAFDKSTPAASLASSAEYSDLMVLYSRMGKAALASGDWEQGLQHFLMAQAVAEENAKESAAAMAPTLESWKKAVADGKKQLEQGAARRAELKAKAKLDESEKAELGNFDVFEKNVRTGPITVARIEGNLDGLRSDAEGFNKAIQGVKRTLEDEKKQISEKPFFGDKAKYVKAVLNPQNLVARQTLDDKLNFLSRLAFLDPKNPQVRKEVDKLLGRTPAPEPKAAKGKKKGK